MNIQFQLCGLLVLIILYIFYKSHRTLKLYKEKVFNIVMVFVMVSLILDISSLIVIQYRDILSDFFVKFVCKTYIISLIWATWVTLVYIFTEILSEKEHRKKVYKFSLFTMIQSIIVYLLPIYIYDIGSVTYTYGPAVIFVYIFVAIYIILTLIFTFAYYKKMNTRRALAVIMWMYIWIVSAVIQFLNSELLIVGFASALGVLILFVIMENPEANIDRELDCFNSYALTNYLRQLFDRNMEFHVLEISFLNNHSLEEQGLDVYDVMKKILYISKQRDHVFVFKNIGLGLILISDNQDKLLSIFNEIHDNLSLNKDVLFILSTHAQALDDTDHLFRFLSFAHTQYQDKNGPLFIVDHHMITKYKEQYIIEQEIEDALLEDRVEVFLQPIYSNHEKIFTSAEALMRIRTKDGNLLSPGIFIPIAENSGQIIELGERIFEKVCDFIKNTDIISMGVHYIEINLSIKQCEQNNLSQRLISIIEQYGINPQLINLEITETASISSRNTLLENMKRLIEYGFTFSLDDFGKGESNLMYVVEMPVSIVKLDYDLSKAFFKSSKAKQVVRAVVNMAHGMNLKVVAEGIEEENEVNAMNNENVDYIQGFYYSKPLPCHDYIQFLKNAHNI